MSHTCTCYLLFSQSNRYFPNVKNSFCHKEINIHAKEIGGSSIAGHLSGGW